MLELVGSTILRGVRADVGVVVDAVTAASIGIGILHGGFTGHERTVVMAE